MSLIKFSNGTKISNSDITKLKYGTVNYKAQQTMKPIQSINTRQNRLPMVRLMTEVKKVTSEERRQYRNGPLLATQSIKGRRKSSGSLQLVVDYHQ